MGSDNRGLGSVDASPDSATKTESSRLRVCLEPQFLHLLLVLLCILDGFCLPLRSVPYSLCPAFCLGRLTYMGSTSRRAEGGEKVRSPTAPSLHLNLRSQTCQAALPTEPSLPLGSCDCFLLSFLHTKRWAGRKPGIPSAGALHYFLWYAYTQLTPLQIVY